MKSAVWLDDPARHAVHLLKYGGWFRIAESLAEVMDSRIPGLGSAIRGLPSRRAAEPPPPPGRPAVLRSVRPVLVPIPLSAAREQIRGYNQAMVLARAVGQRTGLMVRASLGRNRDTGTQTALTPEERRANLAGAFTVAGTAPRIAILVDDVFTTGATLAEAAGVLLQAGTAEVTAVTFARAVRPLDPASSLSVQL
ncbi:MAG: ComF family protein [Gemmatimonadales bacterium]